MRQPLRRREPLAFAHRAARSMLPAHVKRIAGAMRHCQDYRGVYKTGGASFEDEFIEDYMLPGLAINRDALRRRQGLQSTPFGLRDAAPRAPLDGPAPSGGQPAPVTDGRPTEDAPAAGVPPQSSVECTLRCR